MSVQILYSPIHAILRKKKIAAHIFRFIFLSTFRISEFINLLDMNVRICRKPICDNFGVTQISVLEVSHEVYKTKALGFSKKFTLPVLKRPTFNIINTVYIYRTSPVDPNKLGVFFEFSNTLG